MKIVARISAFLAIAALSLGCGTESSLDSAQVKIFHALSNALSIDFIVDGERTVTGLGYGLESREFEFEEGTRRVEVEVEGLLAPVIDENVSFSDEQRYKIFVVGSLTAPSIIVKRDTLESGPLSDEDFRIRIVDLSIQNRLYDVYIIGVDRSIANVGATFENVNFREITRYRDIPKGVFEVVITEAGSKSVVLESGPLTISDAKDFSYILIDQPSGGAPLLGTLVRDN